MSALDPSTMEVLKIGLPALATFVLGFLTRWTMTRKEKADVSRAAFHDTRDLMERQEQTYHAYVAAISAYTRCDKTGEVDHFLAIATTGDIYFYQLKIACDAILSGRVDPVARDNTLLPKIREATLRTLPAHYETLQIIAKKKGFAFDGELRRDNYQSLYAVIEKFGHAPAWKES